MSRTVDYHEDFGYYIKSNSCTYGGINTFKEYKSVNLNVNMGTFNFPSQRFSNTIYDCSKNYVKIINFGQTEYSLNSIN